VVTRKLTVVLFQPMPGLEEPDRKRLLPVRVCCSQPLSVEPGFEVGLDLPDTGHSQKTASGPLPVTQAAIMTDRFRCIAVLIIVKIECLLLGHKLKFADVRFVSVAVVQVEAVTDG
jgi:hypothetical protein